MSEINAKLHEMIRRISVLSRRESGDPERRNYPDTQNRALSVIALNDGISQSQLSYILGTRPQSTGEIVRKLERRNLIERKTDEKDNRLSNLYLTEDGKRRVELINNRVGSDDMFDVLTEEEKETLNELLGKVIEANPYKDRVREQEVVELRMPDYMQHHRPHMEVRNMPYEDDRYDRRDGHGRNHDHAHTPQCERERGCHEGHDDHESFDGHNNRVL